MKKYIFIVILIIAVAAAFYQLWGWSGRVADDKEECTMLKVKVEMFEKAINELGAYTPSDAALLWSKGVQTRNGALQYAVMSDELKKKFKEEQDQNNPGWVTGVSSPWVEQFELIEAKKISKDEYEIIVQFSLATSAGSAGKHLVKLSVYNDGQYWVINNVAGDELMLDLSGLSFLK